MSEIQKTRIPTDWHEEHTEKVVNGNKVIDGRLSGGDLLGTYLKGPETMMLTIANSKADWAIRVIANVEVNDALKAAVAAAESLGFVVR